MRIETTIDIASLKENRISLEVPLKNPNFAICFTDGK